MTVKITSYNKHTYVGIVWTDIKSIEIDNLEGSILKWFPNLITLICSNGKIDSIPNLRVCPRLESLFCSNNRIQELDFVTQCPQLKHLYLSDNRIRELDPLISCTKLETLCISGNPIKSFDPLRYCQHLRDLYISYTNSLFPIFYLKLDNLIIHNLPDSHESIQLTRYISYMKKMNSSIIPDEINTVYINPTLSSFIQSLLNDTTPKCCFENVRNSKLGPSSKMTLLRYLSDDTLHPVHLLTYKELFDYIWPRLNEKSLTDLEHTISHPVFQTLTGRFNLSLGIINGFCPDIRLLSTRKRVINTIMIDKLKELGYSSDELSILIK